MEEEAVQNIFYLMIKENFIHEVPLFKLEWNFTQSLL